MTMRITMNQARMGESGSLLTAGSTNTVSDAFGAAMVGAGYATDTDGALTPPDSEPVRLSADGTSLVSGDGNRLTSGNKVVRSMLRRGFRPDGRQRIACWG